MVQKRPHGEDLYEASSKQPRQLESGDEMVSSLEFPVENVASKPHTLGDYGQFPTKGKSECDVRLHGGNEAELQTWLEKELEASVPGSISNSSWATSTTSEEDIRSEAPFHIVLSPDRHDIDHPLRTIIHVGDIYSTLMEYPPRKPVPVGSDYQAEIPKWGVHGAEQKSICSGDTSEALNLASQSSKSDFSGNSDYESRLAGTCIIPMPELNMYEDHVEKVGVGRNNCSCGDEGSIRCVQQHIREAREKLRTTLGLETFAKLGFCDMGEEVAEKWSEEEELIFHEVVSNNPVTLGKNFWDYLAIEFPSRMKEIVSYYFNVFMLRKRALQNRSNPLHIDSDNDEWDGTDDSANYVIENGKECDDSGVESPVYEDDFGHDEFHENVHESSKGGFPKISVHDVYEYLGDNKVIYNESENYPAKALDNRGAVPTFLPSDQVVSNDGFHEDTHEPSKDGAPETSGRDARDNFCDNKVISNVAENFAVEAFDHHSTVPTFRPSDRFMSNEPGVQDVQRGECASNNTGGTAPEEVSSEKANGRKHWIGSLSGGSSSGGQEFLLEPCSSKEWDTGYLTHPKNEDFLPTCSMIEEVFGNEASNCKTTDD